MYFIFINIISIKFTVIFEIIIIRLLVLICWTENTGIKINDDNVSQSANINIYKLLLITLSSKDNLYMILNTTISNKKITSVLNAVYFNWCTSATKTDNINTNPMFFRFNFH